MLHPLLPIRPYLLIQTYHHHGGIPLENAGEILDVDPYEEVAQQGQTHPLSPAYVPDPMDLDEHAEDQPYAEDASPTAESPGYIADSDPMEDDTNADFINYPNEPETKDKDPEEDLSEEHEPKNEDAMEDESSEDSDETELFEENKTAATPPPP
ncbi:hypothetical protein Tco_0193025, partial [Tanacetum coccineum]